MAERETAARCTKPATWPWWSSSRPRQPMPCATRRNRLGFFGILRKSAVFRGTVCYSSCGSLCHALLSFSRWLSVRCQTVFRFFEQVAVKAERFPRFHAFSPDSCFQVYCSGFVEILSFSRCGGPMLTVAGNVIRSFLDTMTPSPAVTHTGDKKRG
jgi:hypothetical protein